MKEQINNLKEFNRLFCIEHPETPQLVDLKMQELRINLLLEEIEEYKVANSSGNMVEVLDALTDILYIAIGTVVQHGMHDIIESAFSFVHSSNLSKLDENMKPIINGNKVYDPTRPLGKVLKSDRFYPPTQRLELLLETY
jgi:predicted HAD superfamily Cof-like phosphohydrolase